MKHCPVFCIQPATDCEQYPMLNYSLEIYTPSSELLVAARDKQWNTDNIIIDRNLSENIAYSFSLLVSNSVGVVVSNRTHFCELRIQ